MESGKLGMKNQSFSIFHFQLSIIKTPPTHCDEGIFFNVDQQGLEPRTNRLWAGCSNQLSYWSVFEIDRRFTRRSIVTPPTGLEPVTHGLTVRCSTCWAMEDYSCWHLPIFPDRHQSSIFGTIELNFRVRYGNGCTLNVINTNYLHSFLNCIFWSDSWGNRTPVTGVRGRCLNRLTNEP